MTAAGRKHPSGGGRCTYDVKFPTLPASKYWLFGLSPSLCGGVISRHKPYEKCLTFQPQERLLPSG